MKKLTERDFDKEHKNSINETQKALAAQPKVRIYIPSERDVWEGSINGLTLLIKTNQFVSVPRDVATLIENNTKVLGTPRKRWKNLMTAGPRLPRCKEIRHDS